MSTAAAPVITSFAELHDFVTSKRQRGLIYRGVGDAAKHLLVPSVGRVAIRSSSPTALTKYETSTFKAFKRLAVPYLSFSPKNDWEWLALAQHHGLATRLLDWSYNPLVATFFAVEHDAKTDAGLYFMMGPPVADDRANPFAVAEVMRFIPSHLTPRIVAQKGTFTVHPPPFAPFASPKLRKAVIPQDARAGLREDLYRYGISRASLFPGLDGLAAELRWRYATSHERYPVLQEDASGSSRAPA